MGPLRLEVVDPQHRIVGRTRVDLSALTSRLEVKGPFPFYSPSNDMLGSIHASFSLSPPNSTGPSTVDLARNEERERERTVPKGKEREIQSIKEKGKEMEVEKEKGKGKEKDIRRQQHSVPVETEDLHVAAPRRNITSSASTSPARKDPLRQGWQAPAASSNTWDNVPIRSSGSYAIPPDTETDSLPDDVSPLPQQRAPPIAHVLGRSKTEIEMTQTTVPEAEQDAQPVRGQSAVEPRVRATVSQIERGVRKNPPRETKSTGIADLDALIARGQALRKQLREHETIRGHWTREETLLDKQRTYPLDYQTFMQREVGEEGQERVNPPASPSVSHQRFQLAQTSRKTKKENENENEKQSSKSRQSAVPVHTPSTLQVASLESGQMPMVGEGGQLPPYAKVLPATGEHVAFTLSFPQLQLTGTAVNVAASSPKATLWITTKIPGVKKIFASKPQGLAPHLHLKDSSWRQVVTWNTSLAHWLSTSLLVVEVWCRDQPQDQTTHLREPRDDDMWLGMAKIPLTALWEAVQDPLWSELPPTFVIDGKYAVRNPLEDGRLTGTLQVKLAIHTLQHVLPLPERLPSGGEEVSPGEEEESLETMTGGNANPWRSQAPTCTNPQPSWSLHSPAVVERQVQRSLEPLRQPTIPTLIVEAAEPSDPVGSPDPSLHLPATNGAESPLEEEDSVRMEETAGDSQPALVLSPSSKREREKEDFYQVTDSIPSFSPLQSLQMKPGRGREEKEEKEEASPAEVLAKTKVDMEVPSTEEQPVVILPGSRLRLHLQQVRQIPSASLSLSAQWDENENDDEDDDLLPRNGLLCHYQLPGPPFPEREESEGVTLLKEQASHVVFDQVFEHVVPVGVTSVQELWPQAWLIRLLAKDEEHVREICEFVGEADLLQTESARALRSQQPVMLRLPSRGVDGSAALEVTLALLPPEVDAVPPPSERKLPAITVARQAVKEAMVEVSIQILRACGLGESDEEEAWSVRLDLGAAFPTTPLLSTQDCMARGTPRWSWQETFHIPLAPTWVQHLRQTMATLTLCRQGHQAVGEVQLPLSMLLSAGGLKGWWPLTPVRDGRRGVALVGGAAAAKESQRSLPSSSSSSSSSSSFSPPLVGAIYCGLQVRGLPSSIVGADPPWKATVEALQFASLGGASPGTYQLQLDWDSRWHASDVHAPSSRQAQVCAKGGEKRLSLTASPLTMGVSTQQLEPRVMHLFHNGQSLGEVSLPAPVVSSSMAPLQWFGSSYQVIDPSSNVLPPVRVWVRFERGIEEGEEKEEESSSTVMSRNPKKMEGEVEISGRRKEGKDRHTMGEKRVPQRGGMEPEKGTESESGLESADEVPTTPQIPLSVVIAEGASFVYINSELNGMEGRICGKLQHASLEHPELKSTTFATPFASMHLPSEQWAASENSVSCCLEIEEENACQRHGLKYEVLHLECEVRGSGGDHSWSIGAVDVPLWPLKVGLPQIDGWYEMKDPLDEAIGYLRVSVSPQLSDAVLDLDGVSVPHFSPESPRTAAQRRMGWATGLSGSPDSHDEDAPRSGEVETALRRSQEYDHAALSQAMASLDHLDERLHRWEEEEEEIEARNRARASNKPPLSPPIVTDDPRQGVEDEELQQEYGHQNEQEEEEEDAADDESGNDGDDNIEMTSHRILADLEAVMGQLESAFREASPVPPPVVAPVAEEDEDEKDDDGISDKMDDDDPEIEEGNAEAEEGS
jgi:hypothetical protein